MKNTVFVTNENNDLIKALKYSGHAPKTEEDVLKAVSLLEENGKLFILASEYPEKATVLTDETLSLAKERNIKIYIEYIPSSRKVIKKNYKREEYRASTNEALIWR